MLNRKDSIQRTIYWTIEHNEKSVMHTTLNGEYIWEQSMLLPPHSVTVGSALYYWFSETYTSPIVLRLRPRRAAATMRIAIA